MWVTSKSLHIHLALPSSGTRFINAVLWQDVYRMYVITQLVEPRSYEFLLVTPGLELLYLQSECIALT